MAPVLEAKLHSLKGTRHVIDIRNSGLVGAVELSSRPNAIGARTFEVFLKCWEKGVMVRQTADILAIAPALIVEESHIDEIVETAAVCHCFRRLNKAVTRRTQRPRRNRQ
jgi:beta-alanine--pyruvate transaminase